MMQAPFVHLNNALVTTKTTYDDYLNVLRKILQRLLDDETWANAAK